MTTETIPDVVKQITVDVPAARAFTVFTEHLDTWWPRSHHIGGGDLAEAILEPKAGGRWYERSTDGTECDWGRVLTWEPPTRLVLTWEITPDWAHDPTKASELEVLFVPLDASRTRVELTHRKLDVFGEDAMKLREPLDSDGGWQGMLALFAGRLVDAA